MGNVLAYGDFAIVELTRGQTSIIDAADADLVCRYSWHVVPSPSGGFYARGHVSGKSIYLHRFILDAPSGRDVDHIDHDTLNNRRANLRIVTHQQNGDNRKSANRNSQTGIRGVSPANAHGVLYWCASVMVGGAVKRKHFPYTPEGFEQALSAVTEMRALHMEQGAPIEPTLPNSGVRGVYVQKGRHGRLTYRAKRASGELKSFPFTPEGLEQARGVVGT